MEIYIKNNKSSNHSICRMNGQKINIKPKDFVIIDTDNEQEIRYWSSVKQESMNKIGITVSTDERTIQHYITNNNDSHIVSDTNINSLSITDNTVSPVARQIAESYQTKKPVEKNSDTTNDNGYYTEDQLLEMDKEDLINICNNFSIKFRKNSSVKTLVALIKNSGVI